MYGKYLDYLGVREDHFKIVGVYQAKKVKNSTSCCYKAAVSNVKTKVATNVATATFFAAHKKRNFFSIVDQTLSIITCLVKKNTLLSY